MNHNSIRAAIELVDVAPSSGFRSTLRAQLLAEFTRSESGEIAVSKDPTAICPESLNEYVRLEPNQSRFFPNKRLWQTLAAAAACVAVLATGAAIISRAGRDAATTIELHD